jgi:hypothetical protein
MGDATLGVNSTAEQHKGHRRGGPKGVPFPLLVSLN